MTFEELLWAGVVVWISLKRAEVEMVKYSDDASFAGCGNAFHMLMMMSTS